MDTNEEKENEKGKVDLKNLDDKREYIINNYYKNADCIIMGYDVTN